MKICDHGFDIKWINCMIKLAKIVCYNWICIVRYDLTIKIIKINKNKKQCQQQTYQ